MDKRKKKKKNEEKMEETVIDVVKKNMESLKKKKKKEEFRSDGNNSSSRDTEEMKGSQTDTVEKKNNKRKRATDGEDLGKHEKKRSKSTTAGIDQDIHDEQLVDISHKNLKKKEKRKDLRDAAAIKLEERNKNENGDNILQEKKEDIYEVEQRKKWKRKKEKSGSSCSIEKDIYEEEKAENVRKGEEKKDGSKTNENFKKASKSEEKCKRENKGKAKATTTANNDEVKNTANRKERKKVQFSDEVEVFSAPSDSRRKSRKDLCTESKDVVWGTRFTKEEDEVLLKSIDDYIQVKQLGDQGRDMIYYSSKHKLSGCWKEIRACLPHRPHDAIYYRGRQLLRRNAADWTPEDYENLKQFQAAHGNQWKKFADLHFKNRLSVKDTWRRLKNAEEKNGPWTSNEYQALFDLVNLDLKLKVYEEEPKTRSLLRDNIAWGAISDKLGTRNHAKCCFKWYYQLASPLVCDDLWSDSDDYRLILALQKVDANCIEEVDWDNLLPHREGEICLKRWLQMVRYIGEHKERPFIEKVEILSKRYCPEMLEYRSGKDED